MQRMEESSVCVGHLLEQVKKGEANLAEMNRLMQALNGRPDPSLVEARKNERLRQTVRLQNYCIAKNGDRRDYED